ncbi:hypothetical protein ASG49_11460 [Marmoricola sp. Leaf446]|uniref:hypothetical protein n=1 Tax=Marmoricola sp. Leaf446 TaxID=1736379 RepID=UPI000701C2F7|nr:hypothetical protein [Marmoricola sp. Leaf446]KQT91612.1 hypothetical protein ASG49_11460 [Marmoricola sp. Leaf446]
MRLPLPDPRELPRVLLGLPERVFGLLDSAEALIGRVDALLVRIEDTRQDAAAVVRRVDAIAADAEPLVGRLGGLLDRLEPSLTRLEPTLRTLADTTSPAEVAALVTMVDHLPELTRRLETEVLPIMATLGSVAPDMHDLLDVSRELNEMLGKLPGMGRIRKRVEEQQDEQQEQEALAEQRGPVA